VTAQFQGPVVAVPEVHRWYDIHAEKMRDCAARNKENNRGHGLQCLNLLNDDLTHKDTTFHGLVGGQFGAGFLAEWNTVMGNVLQPNSIYDHLQPMTDVDLLRDDAFNGAGWLYSIAMGKEDPLLHKALNKIDSARGGANLKTLIEKIGEIDAHIGGPEGPGGFMLFSFLSADKSTDPAERRAQQMEIMSRPGVGGATVDNAGAPVVLCYIEPLIPSES